MVEAPINCTPHDVHVTPPGMPPRVYKRTEHNVRLLSEPQQLIGHLPDGTPIFTAQEFTGVSPLPPGSAPIIVSMAVGEYLKKAGGCGRMVLGPDTSPEGSLRKDGVIVGTTRLVFYCLDGSGGAPA